jgi:hypothetical protein
MMRAVSVSIIEDRYTRPQLPLLYAIEKPLSVSKLHTGRPLFCV